jgi:hypothetical protein
METPEESLKWAVVIILLAVFVGVVVRLRYGSVWRKLVIRLGPRWPLFIKIASMATLAVWILVWVLVSPERRGELRQYYQETAPWVVR